MDEMTDALLDPSLRQEKGKRRSSNGRCSPILLTSVTTSLTLLARTVSQINAIE
jgi:hypothetical protein